MPEGPLDLAPVSDATTRGIRVEVMARHAPEASRPGQYEWVFEYTVRITNNGSETVQLLHRRWIITDAADHSEEVAGPGVIGQHPVLEPGQAFTYSSWCPLQTPTGSMRGSYQMELENGERFDVEIAPLALKARQSGA